ncbi:hypothetical protein YQ44_10075 [Janthinobacterium sp. 1_2014MBL_MicDiv]|nr:hypothetical protein YQ44_10075 [Janthinobacterium sp. 1_2014MBL_MicDiv]
MRDSIKTRALRQCVFQIIEPIIGRVHAGAVEGNLFQAHRGLHQPAGLIGWNYPRQGLIGKTHHIIGRHADIRIPRIVDTHRVEITIRIVFRVRHCQIIALDILLPVDGPGAYRVRSLRFDTGIGRVAIFQYPAGLGPDLEPGRTVTCAAIRDDFGESIIFRAVLRAVTTVCTGIAHHQALAVKAKTVIRIELHGA